MTAAHSELNLAGCCARHETWRDLTLKRACLNFPRLLTSFFKALFKLLYFTFRGINMIKSKEINHYMCDLFKKSSIRSFFITQVQILLNESRKLWIDLLTIYFCCESRTLYFLRKTGAKIKSMPFEHLFKFAFVQECLQRK